MTSKEIRARFIEFFRNRGHVILPSAPLVPKDDPTVLFNTAGMQPLVPFLMGAKHPQGDKLANIQKCVRTTDIEDIGDNTHATFFEMLGNWSLGDYFKKEAISWSHEFLTSKEEGLGLDPKRLYVTVFGGNDEVEPDHVSAQIWQSLGIPENRIFFKGVDSNWWPAVKEKDAWTGPTGPCTEMFYDVAGDIGDIGGVDEFNRLDSEQRIVEIWNDVFMEYEKRDGRIVSRLKQKNVDTGAGLERLAMIMQGVRSIFETDLFVPIIDEIRSLSRKADARSERILADHLRTGSFLVVDGVLPANSDRGYVLRRLIRRAVVSADSLGLPDGSLSRIIRSLVEIYDDQYGISRDIEKIEKVVNDEEVKFRKTLKDGIKEFEKFAQKGHLTGSEVFLLFSTYGFPLELTIDFANRNNVTIDTEEFEKELNAHRALSRSGAERKFKGGLSDTSEESVRYHTATHLLGAAIRQIVGSNADQRGSNITPERLRFDFAYDQKLSERQIKEIENFVNEKIEKDLPVKWEELAIDEARKLGAVGVFGEKYSEIVRVYTIGDPNDPVSREICGGPHVEHTGVLGCFRILKEESVSAGVRRIKAVLE